MGVEHRTRMHHALGIVGADNVALGGGESAFALQRRPEHARLVPWGVRGWTTLTWSTVALLLVHLAATSGSTALRTGVVAVMAHAPLGVGAAVTARTLNRRRAQVAARMRLASRAEEAEADLAHEQERMHELRATVTGIVLSHRLLTSRRHLARTTRRRLERLRTAELERIERMLGDHPCDPLVPVELARVLDPLVDGVRLRGHSVRWQGTRCRALGRADDIAQIAHILLENAVRHGHGRQVAVDVAERAGLIELRVSDHGPGVPPELAPFVFERGARSVTSAGQGIGLHVARRLACELGGDLRLETGPAAGGAAFALHLPQPNGAVPCRAPAD